MALGRATWFLAVFCFIATANALTVEDIFEGCGVTSGCFVSPDGCKGLECDYIVSWIPDVTDTKIAIAARYDKDLLGEDQYISIGFSEDGKMDGAAVVDCIYFGGHYYAQESYNLGYTNILLDDLPEDLEPSYGFKGEMDDGHITCDIKRYNSIPNEPMFGDLNKPSYLLIAQGVATSKTLKEYHTIRLASPTVLDFTVVN